MKTSCPYCYDLKSAPSSSRTLIRAGVYRRKSDGQVVQRFWCKRCENGFSSSTLSPNYAQQKRQKNDLIRKLLCAKVSQREAARVAGVNRKTIARKLCVLGRRARRTLTTLTAAHPPAQEVQFDDLETFEHTKCKPLSVTLMVEAKTRRIIDFEVSQMPAKGLLAKRARRRYGFRADHRPEARERLFQRAVKVISPRAQIISDSNPHYAPVVKRYFPEAVYKTILGGRSSVSGQGELKKVGFDPIFSLNHTCAMLRDHLGGLVRKTWGGHKRRERLALQLAIYAVEHNRRLTARRGAS